MNAPVKITAPVTVVIKPGNAAKPGMFTRGQIAQAKAERWSARRSLLFIFMVCCVLWSPFVAFAWIGGGEWLGAVFAKLWNVAF